MDKISSLFNMPEQGPKKDKRTERGELLKEFSQKTGKPIGYIAMRLTGFQMQDLYYLKSTCDDAARRGTPWSKAFFGSIKSKK